MEGKNQTLTQKINTYLQDAIFLTQYQLGKQDPDNHFLDNDKQLKRQLRIDTLKCMLVTSTIFIGYRFSQGRNYYLNYIKSIIQGSAVGFGISIYYTREKMKEKLVVKYLESQQNQKISQEE